MKKRIALQLAVLAVVAGVSYAAGAAGQKTSAVIMPADEMKWEKLKDFERVVLWGNPSEGEHAILFRVRAGYEVPPHSHSVEDYGINLKGSWVHRVEGDTSPPKVLPPMSFVGEPRGDVHSDSCKGPDECIFMFVRNGKADFIPAKKP